MSAGYFFFLERFSSLPGSTGGIPRRPVAVCAKKRYQRHSCYRRGRGFKVFDFYENILRRNRNLSGTKKLAFEELSSGVRIGTRIKCERSPDR